VFVVIKFNHAWNHMPVAGYERVDRALL